MYIFGGWSSQWLNDLHSLDVSGIVGPPYACMAVSPRLGPVSGGTSVCINGLSFPQGDVKVQFFDGKNQV